MHNNTALRNTSFNNIPRPHAFLFLARPFLYQRRNHKHLTRAIFLSWTSSKPKGWSRSGDGIEKLDTRSRILSGMDNCKFHLDDTKLPPIGHESALAIGLIVLLLHDSLHISGSLLRNSVVFTKKSRLNWLPFRKAKYSAIAVVMILRIFL